MKVVQLNEDERGMNEKVEKYKSLIWELEKKGKMNLKNYFPDFEEKSREFTSALRYLDVKIDQAPKNGKIKLNRTQQLRLSASIRMYERDFHTDEETKESIEKIEELSLYPEDKVNYILTLVGKKPASMIYFKKLDKKILDEIGLPYKARRKMSGYDILIGREEKIVDSLEKLMEKSKLHKIDYHIFGKLFGYPERAIKSFNSKIRRGVRPAEQFFSSLRKTFGPQEEIPDEYAFISFVPSQVLKNGELPLEEQMLAEDYARTVGILSPKAYKEAVYRVYDYH